MTHISPFNCSVILAIAFFHFFIKRCMAQFFFKPTALTSCQSFLHNSEVSIIVITRKLIFQSSENSLLKHNEMLTFNYTCRNIHVHLGNFRKAVTGLRLNIIDTAHYTIFPPFHSAVFFPLEYPDLSSEYHFAANQK